jgi:putative ABC transport system ATP-binding protein
VTALIRALDVQKTYGAGALATRVLHGVSFELPPGELCLLMGPSGSGKTTLISILAGLLRPTRGAIELCGRPIAERPSSEVSQVRRHHLGFVFQTYNLFPALSALDNVAEVLRLKGVGRAAALVRARAALVRVGLADRMGHRPDELSGGQKQRVAIARAIAGEPDLVVGDEITSALDGATAVTIMELLRGWVGPRNAVLLVTHDHRMERFADRVVELEDGRVVRERRGGWS